MRIQLTAREKCTAFPGNWSYFVHIVGCFSRTLCIFGTVQLTQSMLVSKARRALNLQYIYIYTQITTFFEKAVYILYIYIYVYIYIFFFFDLFYVTL